MKYSEFEIIVKEAGYEIIEEEDKVFIIDPNHKKTSLQILLSISKDCTYVFDTSYNAFEQLDESKKNYLSYNAYILSATPIEEREEEKRYRLKFIGQVDDGYEYLYILMGKRAMDIIDVATIFTESELEHIDETGFIREEVTE